MQKSFHAHYPNFLGRRICVMQSCSIPFWWTCWMCWSRPRMTSQIFGTSCASNSVAASNLPHFKPCLALPRKLFGDTPTTLLGLARTRKQATGTSALAAVSCTHGQRWLMGNTSSSALMLINQASARRLSSISWSIKLSTNGMLGTTRSTRTLTLSIGRTSPRSYVKLFLLRCSDACR